MIPGALVSIILCRLLGIRADKAALVVAFGTIGIGCGGNMTYGQTLGLIRLDESFWWGLTGTTTKGTMWGLFGGAVLGVGFSARSMPWGQLIAALTLLPLGMAIGIEVINVPRVIYFSDPVNKPRDESWAGMLLAAVLILAYVRFVNVEKFRPMATFASYGAVGGGLGFGIGSLFLGLEPHVSDAWNWLPYWKFMEFTFGFMLGASLGLGARRSSAVLKSTVDSATKDKDVALPLPTELVTGAGTVLLVFSFWPQAISWCFPNLGELARSTPGMTLVDVLTDFPGLGCLLLLFARRWSVVAWQLSISVTIVAAAIDWQRDLQPRGGIDMPDQYRMWFVLNVAILSIGVVEFWLRHRPRHLSRMFLFATCALMGFGYLMGLSMSDIWWPDPQEIASAGGRAAFLWQSFRAEIVVHTIFTTLFVLSLWFGLREHRNNIATEESS